jgi:hypothetical protein
MNVLSLNLTPYSHISFPSIIALALLVTESFGGSTSRITPTHLPLLHVILFSQISWFETLERRGGGGFRKQRAKSLRWLENLDCGGTHQHVHKFDVRRKL